MHDDIISWKRGERRERAADWPPSGLRVLATYEPATTAGGEANPFFRPIASTAAGNSRRRSSPSAKARSGGGGEEMGEDDDVIADIGILAIPREMRVRENL